MRKLNTYISKFNKKNILVIGDLILDQYIQGSVSRISPEAPVPVVHENDSYSSPGGAANVAHNLIGLQASISIVGRVGNDEEGKVLKSSLSKEGVDVKGIFLDKKLPTICKTRVIANNQQVVRIDREKVAQTSKDVNQKIINFVKNNIQQYDAVIVSDYGKGLVTPELINFVCKIAHKHKKYIVVDPKVEHFGYYRGVTCITPNLNEAENAIRNIKITAKSGSDLSIQSDKLKDEKAIQKAGQELLKYLDLESLLITVGEQGMRLFEKGKKAYSIKTKAQEVFDVTGAGDSVIATFTLCLAVGANKQEAAEIANSAAGIVVGKRGCVPITKKELLEVNK